MIDFFVKLWHTFLNSLADILPLSPFQPYIDAFGQLPYLGWLNWFIPVRGMLLIFSAWLGAVALFYLYQILLRWLRVIGG